MRQVQAAIASLRMAAMLEVTRLKVRRDLMLVVRQVNGEYVVKDDQMAIYLQIILSLKSKFSR